MRRAPCYIICIIIWALPAFVRANPFPAPPDSSKAPVLVSSVKFVGNEFFSDEILSFRIRTTANRRLLGIPGLTWWLWLYQLGSSGSLGRFGKALMSSGEAPAYLDKTVLDADVERIKLAYRQEGFRDAEVKTEIDTVRQGRFANVMFRIAPGRLTFLRNVNYDGISELNDEDRKTLIENSLLSPGRFIETGFVAKNQRFSEVSLLDERRRILSFLRDGGFALVTRDSIRAIVHPFRPDSFDVVFQVRPGKRHRFGEILFDVNGPEESAATKIDTLSRSASGSIVSHFKNERVLNNSLLTRSLKFEPGEWYNQSRVISTKRQLDASGVFSFSDILQQTPLYKDSMSAPLLPLVIDLRTRRRHQIRFETFMLNRTGVLGGSESELGTGVGISYENLNFLGGGESFQVRSTGSISADFVSDSTLAAQAEISTSLSFPYLVFPFRGIDNLLNLYAARTRLSFSLLTARRDELRLIIRGRGLARFRLELQHNPTITSLVDVIDISVSNPDTLIGFRRAFLDNIIGKGDSLIVKDPVQRAQIIEDYTQPQINSALRYTLRSSRVDPLRRDQGYSYEGSVELGSNLPYLMDRFIFSPDTLEGNLPGLPFFSGGREANRLVYRQYIRALADLRKYDRIGRTGVLALKFVGGVVHPMGKADIVPFDRRFYCGGATSVRGWGLRELGPGRSDLMSRIDSVSGYTTNILGGDIKLEMSAELRKTVLHDLFSADWLGVSFIDAGNVWVGPRNPGDPRGRFRFNSFFEEFGIGTGLGVRAAWQYLIVRFDLACKVYDPARPDMGLFPDGLKHLVPHFGIGHAF